MKLGDWDRVSDSVCVCVAVDDCDSVGGCVLDWVRVCVRVRDRLGDEEDDAEPVDVEDCELVAVAEGVCVSVGVEDDVPVDEGVPVADILCVRVIVAVGDCVCDGVADNVPLDDRVDVCVDDDDDVPVEVPLGVIVTEDD